MTSRRASAITILIAEHRQRTRRRLEKILGKGVDFQVVGAEASIEQALNHGSARRSPDVLLIGLDSSDTDSLTDWARIRLELPGTRIFGLTDGEHDQVLETAFGAGLAALHPRSASDHIVRRAVRRAAAGEVDYDPQLLERAKDLLMAPLERQEIRFGGLTIHLTKQRVSRWGQPIHLTPLEFSVLARLARSPGVPVSSHELLRSVWGVSRESGGTSAQVRNCIKRLRNKIEPLPTHPRYLRSVRGWGYLLRDPLR